MFDVWEFQDDFSIPPGSYSARPAPDRRGGPLSDASRTRSFKTVDSAGGSTGKRRA